MTHEQRAGRTDAAVVIDGLTRRFGETTAVDHVNLTVPNGAAFGLLGRNGAGKTTLIKMLITLLPPTEGTARVAGFDVRTQAQQVRRHVGYVPQLLSADGSLTAWENMSVFARLYHIPRRQRRDRIDNALQFMGLTEVAHRLVRDLSGGMIRRLEIVQSMLHRPAVLFLDEPTIGLDPAARREIWRGLRDLIAVSGTALFITTHDMEEAETLCDQVAIMRHGRVVRQGAPLQLRAEIGPDATLEDAFVVYSGAAETEERGFDDTARTREVARRLG
ncbi:ABC-type multidrug transport system, ATPase component [Mycolicibacterium chubuense NBB4]|uniref:ABC-type multidrug transport system, ATPase component n=1 Tax=Mycolicibacterium chubuense (strain NBB4) TaxID=710421 RepID=I4BJ18_MYCCN|nr:ATP-binding cassette domain-containing protein [Mycolicibacterium chubuense]AFM17275.1 ABC-type multidrug transport system, ATPase component [Mycolicibacterium chubuense NBB4]